jgi:chemotaxis response regulator CheB
MLLWEEKVMSDELSAPSPSQQVSVLVVDDADVIRKTLRDFLKGEPAIKLLGEASNFAEAISMTAALKPDVVLLDLHMPDDHSFNPEFVKANLSGARVLAMSLSGDYASEARQCLRCCFIWLLPQGAVAEWKPAC